MNIKTLPLKVPLPAKGEATVVLVELDAFERPLIRIAIVSTGEVDTIYEGLLNDE